MSLSVCIPDLVAAGKLTGDRADRAQQLYDELVQQYAPRFGREAAESMATEKALAALEAQFSQAKRTAALARQVQGRWHAEMKAASGAGPFSPEVARARLERLDKRIDAVRGGYLAGFDKLLDKHRRNLLGEVRGRDDLMLVLRERFGESTGDVNARELAEAMGETMDAMRQRRNAAGGNTAKLDEYVFPQRHDSRLVRKASFEEWRDFGPIARANIRDVETGDWATGLRREAILRAAWESIRTDGADSSRPGAMFGGSLANQRADARTIHFGNADDWLEYQQRFGGDDNIYDIFVGHISSMAREIALMEEMGPNPNATLRFQKDWLRKSAGMVGTQADIDRVAGSVNRLQDVFDELTAANKIPDNRKLALVFSGVRAVQSSAKLGSAILSVVPDFATMIKTARFNRIPVMGALGRYMSLWNPANKADRALAVRLGLVTDDWINLSSASYRYTGEELSGEVSRRMADFVLRAQGLARHTRNGQWAFGMEFLGHLSDMRDRAFGALDDAMQRQWQGYGLSEADWDAYRATKVRSERGSDWIFPTDTADRALGERVLEMVLTESDYAILMPDIRTRTQINRFAGRPGSWGGELTRSAFLFKSFPLTMINLHGRRMMAQPGGWNKATYGLGLFSMLLAGGALSAQLKSIFAGKDAVPMDDGKFLAKAVVQSGGLGIFGDLLYNSTNSFGGGLAQTILGPMAQTTSNVAQLTVGNAVRALDGNPDTETRVGRDAMNLLRYEVPGSNLIWTRLAYQRLFGDMVQSWIDPDAEDYYARANKRAEKEGTAFWLPPGNAIEGARAPDFANALRDPEAEAAPAGW